MSRNSPSPIRFPTDRVGMSTGTGGAVGGRQVGASSAGSATAVAAAGAVATGEPDASGRRWPGAATSPSPAAGRVGSRWPASSSPMDPGDGGRRRAMSANAANGASASSQSSGPEPSANAPMTHSPSAQAASMTSGRSRSARWARSSKMRWMISGSVAETVMPSSTPTSGRSVRPSRENSRISSDGMARRSASSVTPPTSHRCISRPWAKPLTTSRASPAGTRSHHEATSASILRKSALRPSAHALRARRAAMPASGPTLRRSSRVGNRDASDGRWRRTGAGSDSSSRGSSARSMGSVGSAGAATPADSVSSANSASTTVRASRDS